MSHLLQKITLTGENFSLIVVAAVLFVWLMVLACAYHSILSQQIAASKKKMWLYIVTLLPIFGLVVYLPFSIDKEHLVNLPIWKRFKSRLSS